MKKTRPARSLAFASFLVLSVSVVRGQRCMDDVEWEDRGRDGCINFKQGNDKISWTLAGLECIKIEYAGRTRIVVTEYAFTIRIDRGTANVV